MGKWGKARWSLTASMELSCGNGSLVLDVTGTPLASDIGSTAAAARAKGVGISAEDILLHFNTLRIAEKVPGTRGRRRGKRRRGTSAS